MRETEKGGEEEQVQSQGLDERELWVDKHRPCHVTTVGKAGKSTNFQSLLKANK